MDAIVTKDLGKVYGKLTAVEGLSLQIPSGELFALLGVNGAGKTTVVKLLSTLAKPSFGEAFVGGYEITRESRRVREIIGLSPQETALAPKLTVEENLALMCGIHGLSKGKAKERIHSLSQQLSLGEVLRRRAEELSGGWQRRVSIAMALVAEPQILFLDEPTLGLDVLARQELWELIASLKGKVTVILTTHYMEEAQALADRVGILRQGRLLAVGSPTELMEKTGAENFEAAFISVLKEAKE